MTRLLCLTCALLLAGCNPWTLNSMTEGAPLVAEPALEGTWLAGSEVYDVRPAEASGVYRIVGVTRDEVFILEGRLIRLAGRLVLEVRRHPEGMVFGEMGGGFAHQFFYQVVVEPARDTVWAWTLDEQRLEQFLAVTGTPHARMTDGNHLVLTGDAAALRDFMTRAMAEPGLLERSDEPMVRVR